MSNNAFKIITGSSITSDAFSQPSDDAANDAMASKRREFSQSNLVSDDQTGHLNASIQDPNLINPWGVAFSPTGPFWVNNNHTGTATIYDVDPKTNAIMAFPASAHRHHRAAAGRVRRDNRQPDGHRFQHRSQRLHAERQASHVHHGHRGRHHLGLERRHQTTLEVDNSADPAHGDRNSPPDEGIGAVYKGLAIATQKDGTTLLYATNFRHGTVDVFNDQWQQVNSLTDGDLPAGYAPFNAQVLDGHLFVSFAQQDPVQAR